jgi:DNA-binding protein YbaB
MNIKTEKEPKTGDFEAFRTEISVNDGNKKFSLVAKISRTEMSIAINKECVKDEKEALEALKQYSIDEALKIYKSGQFKNGDKFEKWFSPCW